ncbi:MAG: hypothetical protein LH631_00990, partial [Alkalinema sp. CAN_BIN05]|nr:hypothetical protein [Alkalinema sp. CAN_BIN05]
LVLGFIELMVDFMKPLSKSRIKELHDIMMGIALIPFQRENIVSPTSKITFSLSKPKSLSNSSDSTAQDYAAKA